MELVLCCCFQRCLFIDAYYCISVHGYTCSFEQSHIVLKVSWRIPGNTYVTCLSRSAHSSVTIGPTDKWTDRRWKTEPCVWAWWLKGGLGRGLLVQGTQWTWSVYCYGKVVTFWLLAFYESHIVELVESKRDSFGHLVLGWRVVNFEYHFQCDWKLCLCVHGRVHKS